MQRRRTPRGQCAVAKSSICFLTALSVFGVSGFPAHGQTQPFREQEAEPFGQSTSAQLDKHSELDHKTVDSSKARTSTSAQTGQNKHENKLGLALLKNLSLDQRAIWTSAARLRFRDADWLVPLGALTAGSLAADRGVARRIPNSPHQLSRRVSNLGVAALVGGSGGLYVWGKITRDEHKREAGLLSAGAFVDSLIVTEILKRIAGRERPFQDNAKGRFRKNGDSFPSDHAAAAWSIASIIAHEYPGSLTKLLAYGLASAVSASRVRAGQHFPSDVLVGSAIGWFVGQHVYRAHHDSELSGDSWPVPFDAENHEGHLQSDKVASPYVPMDSWVYPAIERLGALGYIHSQFAGLRPWTRSECARQIDEAGVQLAGEGAEAGQAFHLYQILAKEFADELQGFGGSDVQRFRLESLYTRATLIAGPPLRDGYHFDQTIINDFGRPFAEGANLVTGFSASAVEGHFAAYVRGEYQHAPGVPAFSDTVRNVISKVDLTPLQPATPFSETDRFRLLDAYVAVNVKNWQFSYGKQTLWWGPGFGGTMLFSNNAEPINMTRVNRVVPFTLPSILHWMGPTRIEAFFGRFSGHHFINDTINGTGVLSDKSGHPLDPQPFVYGGKYTFKPTPNLELGFSLFVTFGGPGLPLNFRSFSRSVAHLGPDEGVAKHDAGDRESGFNFSYRIPHLRDWLILYTDSFSEDQVSPIRYPHRSAMNPGIYMPKVPGIPKLDLRVEAAYTDLPYGVLFPGFYYFNVRYLDGRRNNGNIIGHWVGRQGNAVQAWSTYWFSPQSTIQFGYRHHKVSADFIQGGGTVNDFSVRTNFPIRARTSLSALLQYEKWKFPVLSANARTNFTSSIQITYHPHLGRN